MKIILKINNYKKKKRIKKLEFLGLIAATTPAIARGVKTKLCNVYNINLKFITEI